MLLVTGGEDLAITIHCSLMPLQQCRWQCWGLVCPWDSGPWGCLCTPILLIHSEWSEIPVCIIALVFLYNRYTKWCHWHVHHWAWLFSQWQAHDYCCPSGHSIQGCPPPPCFLQPSGPIKGSTSWADAWFIFRVLCQSIHGPPYLWGGDLVSTFWCEGDEASEVPFGQTGCSQPHHNNQNLNSLFKQTSVWGGKWGHQGNNEVKHDLCLEPRVSYHKEHTLPCRVWLPSWDSHLRMNLWASTTTPPLPPPSAPTTISTGECEPWAQVLHISSIHSLCLTNPDFRLWSHQNDHSPPWSTLTTRTSQLSTMDLLATPPYTKYLLTNQPRRRRVLRGPKCQRGRCHLHFPHHQLGHLRGEVFRVEEILILMRSLTLC